MSAALITGEQNIFYIQLLKVKRPDVKQNKMAGAGQVAGSMK